MSLIYCTPSHPSYNLDSFLLKVSHPILAVSLLLEIETRFNDPGKQIEDQSTRFLATHSHVIDTLLPISSENKDNVFNHGVLASKEKSPPSSSHRGFKASKLFHHKSPMLIKERLFLILDVFISSISIFLEALKKWIFRKKTKMKQNRQNQTRNGKSVKKSKAKSQQVKDETEAEGIIFRRSSTSSRRNKFGIFVVSLAWETISEIEHAFEDKQYQPEGILELFRKLHDDVQNIHEELAEYINTPSWNRPTIYCDDDDDDDEDYTIAITPDLPITDSLIMEDEHLDTIPATESDELIKSSVENLVPIPSESEDLSDGECDVPDCDDSQTTNFSTFSNPLFDDSTSSDDESSHEEVIHEISFKTYSNPLFDLDEEIISSEFNPIHNEDLDSTPKNDRFDTESYLLESLLNRDTLMASSPKIDSLLDEFAGELITIPPRIVNREHEEYISLMERLLYDNSSPRPPEDFHANPIIESLSTFPIPVEDSDSLREEIDIFPGMDDSIPPGIESDDYDSKGDDNSTSLPEFESFHVDYPDSGDSTIDVVEDIPVDVPNILPTHPTLHMDFDFIPSHNDLGSDLNVSSPSGDRNKIYDPVICIEVESTRFLATQHISPVIDTLPPFFIPTIKINVFQQVFLASKEKSPSFFFTSSAFKASKLFHQKSPKI
ncbi:hypothetical protein Tco_0941281 [Tanacetum coccineum]|uniref:Uncharacterized protein n=1 Tax=Tanacetum coccineum TaxID=301880 RepID=A0ABQ5DT09_9ASTR